MDNMALDFLNYQCIPLSALIGKGKNQLTFDMVDLSVAVQVDQPFRSKAKALLVGQRGSHKLARVRNDDTVVYSGGAVQKQHRQTDKNLARVYLATKCF